MELYRVVKGLGFEDWRSILRAPGGAAAVGGWSDQGEGNAVAHASDPQDGSAGDVGMGLVHDAGPSGRWKKAQNAEAVFWRGWRRNVLYRHLSLADFWEGILEKTGGPLPPGRILDIGCGPVSVLNFCRGAGVSPFGLDPLALTYAAEGLIESRAGWQPISIAALRAESLPFGEGSLDHLICFNVLDHVADAPAVLAELIRVLRPGGSVRIYVHTFASWIKGFLFFDRPHTYHWDHEEFKRLLSAAGFDITLELKEPKSFDLPPGLFGKLRFFPYWVASKVGFTSYFQLTKPE